MSVRHKTEYFFVMFLNRILSIMPRFFVYSMYSSFAKFFYYVGKKRRIITQRNMHIAFPEKTDEERTALSKKCYQNIAYALAYNALMINKRISPEEIIESVDVDADQWNTFEELISNQKKGAIVFTAHLGNWELLPQYLHLKSNAIKLNIITREIDNPLLEQKLVRPFREQYGQQIIYKKNALISVVKAIKKGQTAGILIDQKCSLSNGGLPATFFGIDTISLASSAQLQLKLKVPAIPLFMVKTKNKHFKIIINDPVKWEDNGKPFKEQVKELTQIHHKIVEDAIRQYPDQWFWMHNRWNLKKDDLL